MTSTLPTSTNGTSAAALSQLSSHAPLTNGRGQFDIPDAKISQVIRDRLRERGASFLANDNIDPCLRTG